MKNLKRELIRAKEETKRIQSVPLVIGQFNEIIDANYGIVGQFIEPYCCCVYMPSPPAVLTATPPGFLFVRVRSTPWLMADG